MPTTTKPWTVLHSEDGDESITVPGPDTDVVDALLTLIEETYGGDRFAPDNPAILAAAEGVKVERWFSVTKQMRESEGIDDGFESYYTPNGDGRRSIWVVSIQTSGYWLGEKCEEATDPVDA